MRGHATIRMGSERGLAQVFAAVFALVGLWPLLHGSEPRLWSLGIAAVILALGYLAPRRLAPLNRLWFRLGMALGAVVAPVVMAFIFFTTVTPVGLVMRAFGHDALRRRRDPEATTYWIERDRPVSSMKDQF